MKPAFAVAVLLIATGCLGAPTATHRGDLWSLENNWLRVEVNAAAGRFQVLDKGSGYLWRGPDTEAQAPMLLAIPAAAKAPAIDGDLSDWGEQGATIAITPDMVADARKVDGPADLSARARVVWAAEGLYLGLEVKDDRLVPCGPQESEWWQRDSVEFWVNGDQYAVRFGPWGTNLVLQGAEVRDGTAAYRATEGGYVLEVRVPARILAEAYKRGIGGQFRFALGVNDCDGTQGREGQLYYPIGWAHSNPATFVQATLAGADGKAPAARPTPPASLQPLPAEAQVPGAMAFRTVVRAAGKELPATVTLALDGDTPDLVLTVAADDPQAVVGTFTVLNPLVLDRPGGRILGSRYCDGIGVPTDGSAMAGETWSTSGSLDMPWVGLTDGTLGYLLLWELPTSCDNGAARLDKVRAGGKALVVPSAYHLPIKGKFAAPRTVRYAFTQGGGHVSICKRYRDYARAHGFLVTQKEKLKTKPALARLPGAPDVWGRCDLKFCREAKAAGIDRMLVNGPQAAADMEAIKALGYLISVYDNYEDAFEGDTGRYGDFKTATDAMVLANGDPMKAWLTKGTNPKQFMKRCTALFESVARKWIPPDLARYPYNARFIDVTTACGMVECYSPTHPLVRTDDREARRRLARYVGNELNLVLGGEHGRWYGADIYNYWEGMQSGGFYSWPAGHVGLELPDSREKIGKNYLEWGLGEKNRYPLWELVFHDCVVSTWYWGDSTGHLRQVAPELGYKQDAFNVLYGTVPLYWVNKPYSYDWSKPELRARLLESYRNTCKLAEQVAFEEMLSHEFVTDDRAVQKTTFGDGTAVWVNFGEQPWTLKRDTGDFVLPQYGFYAKGPRIEQWRVSRKWRPEDYRAAAQAPAEPGEDKRSSLVTYVRSGDYLYVEGDLPGVVEASGGLAQTVRREGPDRLRVLSAEGTRWLRLNATYLCPQAGVGQWRVLELDSEGTTVRLTRTLNQRGEMLLIPSSELPASYVLLPPAALAGHAEIMVARPPTPEPAAPRQGTPVAFKVPVTNLGGKAAAGVKVSLVLEDGNRAREVAATAVDVPAGATVTVPLTVDTSRYEGELSYSVHAEPQDAAAELCRADNVAAVRVMVEPNWALWDSYIDVTVQAGNARQVAPIVHIPFDLDAERARLGKPGKADPAAIRVVRRGSDADAPVICTSQYVPDGDTGPELVWQLRGVLEAGAGAACRIYMDGLDTARHEPRAGGGWDDKLTAVHCVAYDVEFRDGYIRGVSFGEPRQKVLSNVAASSKDTGWYDEVGEVQSFTVVRDGPLFTQIRVRKKLNGNHAYDKLYTFYPSFFLVTTQSPERFGTLSRAHYIPSCQLEDSGGRRALVDGKGDAEDVAGKTPNPKWYATWAEDWALACVAVTPHESLTYWDGGNKAAVGFNTGRKEPATVGYFIHQPQAEGFKAPDFAARDYEAIHSAVTVKR